VLISYLDAKGNYGFGRVDKDENLEPALMKNQMFLFLIKTST